MSDTATKTEIIHRRGVLAAVALVIFSLVVAIATVLTGTGERFTPNGEAVATASLRFEDHPDGVVAVFDAVTGARIMDYGVNEGVFVRSVMRTVARQRRMRGEGSEIPVTLSEFSDGQLWLIDDLSGVQIYLDAFGPDNADDFEELLQLNQQTLNANAGAEPGAGE